MKTTPIKGIGFSGIDISLNLADLVVLRSLLKELTDTRDEINEYYSKRPIDLIPRSVHAIAKTMTLLNNLTKEYSGIDIVKAEEELFGEE